jgi:ribosome recycling factor
MSDSGGRMRKTVKRLAEQLAGIRPGNLSVGFVETFRVVVNATQVPLGKLAVIATQGDRILITPFESTTVPAIVKSLVDAKLNAYALNPRTVCVSVPPISGEQKEEMVRHVKKLGEEAKIAIRAIRQDARKEIAARGRGSERAVQEATDQAVEEIDSLVKAKSKSLLS